MNWTNSNCRAKVTKAITERMSDPAIRIKQAEYATEYWSRPGTRESQSLKIRNTWATGIHDNVIGMCLKSSAAEDTVAAALDQIKLDYIRQYRPDGFHRLYDFFIPSLMLMIEVDGWYWHHSADAERRGTTLADVEKDDWATHHGYTVARIENVGMISSHLVPMLQQLVEEITHG